MTSLSFPFVSQGGGTKKQNIDLEQKLYDGVSATSTWLDDVEERLFVATALLPEETETCIFNQEVSVAACVCGYVTKHLKCWHWIINVMYKEGEA